MNAFGEEVGRFLGLSKTSDTLLNQNHVQETYAMQFENCRLDLDLISNPVTQKQTVKGFQLH